MKKYYLLIKITKQAKFTYFFQQKQKTAFEKQTKKQVDALKSLNLSSKIDGFNQISCIFPEKLMNGSILDRLKSGSYKIVSN